MTDPARPTIAEIDLDAIRHNVRAIKQQSGTGFCAVVKADGYGHGAVPVARAAIEAGADRLAVALIEEGEELRTAGIDAPILVLTEPPAKEVERLVAADLDATIYSVDAGRVADALGRRRGRPVTIHVKADTGMGRVGVPPPAWDDFLAEAVTWEGVRVEALWTHLARADELAADTTDHQLDAFADFCERARAAGLAWELTHVGNSAAALAHPRAHHDLLRVGIAMYGLSPSPELAADDHGLRAAMRLMSAVAYVKWITAGTPVSYGHTWSAPGDGWLATVPAGYADGVPRRLSNRAEVLVRGRRFPIVGTVCMDQLLVWCGEDEVAVGDEVVLFGSQSGNRVRVEEWADTLGTITYEIATGIGPRVPRVHRDGGGARGH